MVSITSAPEEEHNLSGAVIYKEIAFERTRLKSASSTPSAGGQFRHFDDPAYPQPKSSLVGRARDLDDIDEAIQFDKESCTWLSLGEGRGGEDDGERGRDYGGIGGKRKIASNHDQQVAWQGLLEHTQAHRRSLDCWQNQERCH
jgi:hypothetical protein